MPTLVDRPEQPPATRRHPSGTFLLRSPASVPRARSSSPRVRPRPVTRSVCSQSPTLRVGRRAATPRSRSSTATRRTLQAAWSSARSYGGGGSIDLLNANNQAHTTPTSSRSTTARPARQSERLVLSVRQPGEQRRIQQFQQPGQPLGHDPVSPVHADPLQRSDPRFPALPTPDFSTVYWLRGSATTAGASSCRVRPRLSARRTPARTSKTSSASALRP